MAVKYVVPGSKKYSNKLANNQYDVTFSATPTFDIDNGNAQRIVLTANITGWTVTDTNAIGGDILVIDFIQDSNGNWTLASPPANVLLAGGSLTLTTTANKRDVLFLQWDATSAKWVELARAVNI